MEYFLEPLSLRHSLGIGMIGFVSFLALIAPDVKSEYVPVLYALAISVPNAIGLYRTLYYAIRIFSLMQPVYSLIVRPTVKSRLGEVTGCIIIMALCAFHMPNE
jgi:hypothetical protein